MDTGGILVVAHGPQAVPMFELPDYSIGGDPKPAVEGLTDEPVEKREVGHAEPYRTDQGVIEDRNQSSSELPSDCPLSNTEARLVKRPH